MESPPAQIQRGVATGDLAVAQAHGAHRALADEHPRRLRAVEEEALPASGPSTTMSTKASLGVSATSGCGRIAVAVSPLGLDSPSLIAASLPRAQARSARAGRARAPRIRAENARDRVDRPARDRSDRAPRSDRSRPRQPGHFSAANRAHSRSSQPSSITAARLARFLRSLRARATHRGSWRFT